MAGGIIALVAIFNLDEDPVRSIHRVPMCVMREDGTKVTMEVWSDQMEAYFYHYPGSTCGTCAAPAECKGD